MTVHGRDDCVRLDFVTMMTQVDFTAPQRLQRLIVAAPEGVDHTNASYVTPGESISTDAAVLRGHGTFTVDSDLVASIGGVVRTVNMLVSVQALKGMCCYCSEWCALRRDVTDSGAA